MSRIGLYGASIAALCVVLAVSLWVDYRTMHAVFAPPPIREVWKSCPADTFLRSDGECTPVTVAGPWKPTVATGVFSVSSGALPGFDHGARASAADALIWSSPATKDNVFIVGGGASTGDGSPKAPEHGEFLPLWATVDANERRCYVRDEQVGDYKCWDEVTNKPRDGLIIFNDPPFHCTGGTKLESDGVCRVPLEPEPVGGPQGPRAINVALGQKIYVDGEPAMTEKEWRAKDKAGIDAAIDDKGERLPAFAALCAKLGIAEPKCNGFTLTGLNQTDQSLWYVGTSSVPDDATLDDGCYKPIAIAHYRIYDGTRGTTYACLVKPEDDHVSDSEIAAIRAYVRRVNALGKKTLQDHQEALEVKRLAAYLVGRP